MPTPEAVQAYATNLEAQRKMRDAIKGRGWKLHQVINSKSDVEIGGRVASLYKYIGPCTLFIPFNIKMSKDSQSGVIRMIQGPHNGPGIEWRSHTRGRSPNADKYQLSQADYLAIPKLFNDQFPTGKTVWFDGVGAPPQAVDEAISWFLRNERDWTGFLEDIAQTLAPASWYLEITYNGKTVYREEMPDEKTAREAKLAAVVSVSSVKDIKR